MNSNPILIFGMDRSGTSLVGNLVSKWGAYGGRSLVTIGDARNPRGYYENIELADFIGEQLVNPFDPEYEQRLADRIHSPAVRQEFEKFVQGMERGGAIWFAKEPILGMMLPFFRSFFADPVCVITVRNPYESAMSWQKYQLPAGSDYRVLSANLLRWQWLMSSTLRHTRGLRKIFLSFEALHEDPEASIHKLTRFLDGCYGRQSDAKVIDAMRGAVDRTLYRNKCETDFLMHPEASEDQKLLYGMLRTALDEPDAHFEVERLVLPPGWNEYVRNANYLCDLAQEANRGLLSRLFEPLADVLDVGVKWSFIRFATCRAFFAKIAKRFTKTAEVGS